jgi:hypothetical protein
MSQRRQWDRDAQPGPAWAQNLIRRAYLIEDRDAADQPDVEQVFETSLPCAVGDLLPIPPSVFGPEAGVGPWRIVAREAAPAPYAARLIVTAATVSS